jgi:hypothetical protein
MDPEQLKLIEEYAGLFFTPDEIALLIDFSPDELKKQLRKTDTDVYRAYMKGKLNTMMNIRRHQITLARNGSPKAEEYVEKLIRLQNASESTM